MERDTDSDEYTPPDINETAEIPPLKLIPKKSKKGYQRAYDQFMNWRKKKQIKTSFSENILLAYIQEMSKKLKPPTLLTQYFKLRSTLFINHNVDISKYFRLKAVLKRVNVGYKKVKPKVLTPNDVNDFITRAPDETFLFAKMALILGISGACSKQELVQLTVDDIDDLKSAAIIRIENPTRQGSRRFTITGIFYDIYKKYVSLRPETTEKRFFLKYQNGECTRHVVGIHKMGAVPKTVASFLKLDNPESYTGHCFRRSSATIPVNGGEDITTLKLHEVWKSEPVKEEYIDESQEDV